MYFYKEVYDRTNEIDSVKIYKYTNITKQGNQQEHFILPFNLFCVSHNFHSFQLVAIPTS